MLTLGIDSSTQGTKAVVFDVETGRVVASASVNYGKDLPEFGSPDGFLPNADARVRRANPAMWIKGLDLVLERLRASGAPMEKIEAIGGDAQQHATVYLAEDGSFSRAESPIWMDSSTGEEVAALDARFGDSLRRRTGSPAIERFAAAQVMKFAKEDPEGWAKTARVHLLSSFLTSYLAGEDGPIDTGDGAGMNLLNLATLEWDREICDFAAPGLVGRLPRVARPGSEPLRLAERFAKYGLRPGIPVVPFTGDNPASLVGCGAEEPGCAVVSLGTSDTFFAAMRDFRTDPDGFGHVFGNPAGGFMSLSCFKNGSLARERVKEECGVDWKFFDETAFELTPPGNNGKSAFPYFETEITPRHDATGIEANFDWASASNEVKIRAIVEAQMSNMRERTKWIGEFGKILVTGGASRSRGIRGVIERVFGAKTETLDVADSAAVGGARLAARAIKALVCAFALGMAAASQAAWMDVGETQVASMKSMEPQLGALASMAQFPMLPMLLPQAIAESDAAKRFGAPRPDAAFGARMFTDGTDTEAVTVWPLAGGVEAWRKAHPKKKIVNGVVTYKKKASILPGDAEKPMTEYAAFSKDGRWVYISQKRELALLMADRGGEPFLKPLKKGIAAVSIDVAKLPKVAFEDLDFAKQIGGVQAMQGDGAKAKGGVKAAKGAVDLMPDGFPGPEFAPFMKEILERQAQSVRVVLGVSANGLDVRVKLDPVKGSDLEKATAKPLSPEAMKLRGVSDDSALAFVCAPVACGGELGRRGAAFMEWFLAAFGDHLEKLAEKEAKNAEMSAFAKSAAFMARAMAAFRRGKAASSYVAFHAAEDDAGAKSMEFGAYGLDGAVQFAEEPPVPPKGTKVKKGEHLMSGKLTQAKGTFEVRGEDAGFKPGKLDAAGVEFTKVLPEHAQAKTPMFAARLRMRVGNSENSATAMSVWLFGWRDGAAYRALMRLPAEELGKALSAMVKTAIDGDDEE